VLLSKGLEASSPLGIGAVGEVLEFPEDEVGYVTSSPL
jgi:hypothetical protein